MKKSQVLHHISLTQPKAAVQQHPSAVTSSLDAPLLLVVEAKPEGVRVETAGGDEVVTDATIPFSEVKTARYRDRLRQAVAANSEHSSFDVVMVNGQKVVSARADDDWFPGKLPLAELEGDWVWCGLFGRVLPCCAVYRQEQFQSENTGEAIERKGRWFVGCLLPLCPLVHLHRRIPGTNTFVHKVGNISFSSAGCACLVGSMVGPMCRIRT